MKILSLSIAMLLFGYRAKTTTSIIDGQAQRDKLSVLPVFNTQSLGLALVTPL